MLFWLDHSQGDVRGGQHSLSLCAGALLTYRSGNWMLPLSLAPVLSDMFKSHIVLHFSISRMYFVKFTEYIHLLKCQPYCNNLLFSCCNMKEIALRQALCRRHCEFAQSLKNVKLEGKGESISPKVMYYQITSSVGFLPATSVPPYLYVSSKR